MSPKTVGRAPGMPGMPGMPGSSTVRMYQLFSPIRLCLRGPYLFCAKGLITCCSKLPGGPPHPRRALGPSAGPSGSKVRMYERVCSLSSKSVNVSAFLLMFIKTCECNNFFAHCHPKVRMYLRFCSFSAKSANV